MALIANGLDLGEGVTDDETIALRKTVIGGQTYPDDYSGTFGGCGGLSFAGWRPTGES